MLSVLIGFAIGFVGSMPVGPINAVLISKSLREGFRHAYTMACGVVSGEIIYNSLAIFGSYSFLMKPTVTLVVQFIAFPILLFYGIHAIRNPYEAPKNPDQVESHHATYAFGLILYLTNPLFIAYWLATIQLLYNQNLVNQDIGSSVLYVAGCMGGALTWLYILTNFIHSKRNYFKLTTIQKFSKLSGILILIFACILIIRILRSVI